MWKYEDGPEDAVDDGDPNDVGPAWLDTFEEDERLSSEKVADGEWILGPRRNALPLRTATNSKSTTNPLDNPRRQCSRVHPDR